MSPVGVSASRFMSALETGTAKLWLLLIGVNHYQDRSLPTLRYAAIDCQGIGAALAAATAPFPDKEFLIHHDLIEPQPTLAIVQSSLERVVAEAKVQDTILIYFSGHGVVEPIGQQTILCLADTDRQQLATTGLPIQLVLEMLHKCAAHSQLLWLDACHSGNLSSNRPLDRQQQHGSISLDPATKLLASLRHRDVKSHGFYALLSCDEGQQSWEFPDLGHGVFSYYLMQGLAGEAADAQGIIDADSLYRYVYRQTMQCIDRTNQQVRLANQVKRERGEMSCAPEYSPQTPKRIVSGVGEIILGIKPQSPPAIADKLARQALIIAAGEVRIDRDLDTLSHVLSHEWQFELTRFTPSGGAAPALLAVREQIQAFLGGTAASGDPTPQPPALRLLYLRGQIADAPATGASDDAGLLLVDGVKLSRNWLGQTLRQSSHNQQILIVDAVGATTTAEWVSALNLVAGNNVSIFACVEPPEDPELFTQVFIEALVSAPSQIDIPVGSLFARVQTTLAVLGIAGHFWVADTQEPIELEPSSPVEQVELLPAIVTQDAESSPSADLDLADPPDVTFGQDNTYFQSQPAGHIPAFSTFNDSLQAILATLVGPIASTLLDRVHKLSQGEDPAVTIENLRLMLPPQFRAAFGLQVQQLLAQQPVAALPPVAHPPLETPVVQQSATHSASGRGIALQQAAVRIDESLLRAYEQELTLVIGPISKFIVASTHKAQPHLSVADAIEVLAGNITDPVRADLFRRRCRECSPTQHQGAARD